MIKGRIEYVESAYYVFSISVHEIKNGVEVNHDIHMVQGGRITFDCTINPDSDTLIFSFEEHEVFRTVEFTLDDLPSDFMFGIRFRDEYNSDDTPTYVYNSAYGEIKYLHPLIKHEIVDYYSI